MMMSSVARVKFIKTKVIFRYHPKGVSNQVSSNSDYKIKSCSCQASQTKFHQIRITKSKVVHVQIPLPKWEKRKLDFLGGGGGSYKSGDYKSGPVLGTINWGKRDYK